MAGHLRVGFELLSAGDGIQEGAGGAGGYFHGIIPRLIEDPRVAELVVYVPAWYERAAEWELPGIRVVRCNISPRRIPRVLYEHVRLPLLARRDRIDVLFSPGNLRPLLYRGTNVVGLHAIQYFLFDDDIGRLRRAYLEFTVPRAVRSADLTVAATETLRDDAVRLFDADADRFAVVPLGPQPWVSRLLAGEAEPVDEPYRLDDGSPYVLCISRLYALKNHRRLIQAFARFLERTGAPHTLVIAGGEADITVAELQQVARDAGVGDRVRFLGRVPQADVPRLYAGAAAIAYVSLYETFGHPVLEAFALGVPLLTSSKGATAEVAGGAAALADPEAVDDIADGLATVLLDEKRRAELVAAGHRRVRDFSWEACAEGTIDALERAVAQRAA